MTGRLACRNAAKPALAYGPQGFKLIYDYLSTHADGDRYAWAMVGFLLGNTVSANGSVSRGVCVTDESRNLVSVTERTCIEPYGP